MRRGLTEAEVQTALGDLDHPDPEGATLPPETVAALRLTDLLTVERPELDDVALAPIREHLDDGEILELSAAIVVGSGWQKMIEAFGIRPDHWSEATPMPGEGGATT